MTLNVDDFISSIHICKIKIYRWTFAKDFIESII